MTSPTLSSPAESYADHVERSLRTLALVLPRFRPALTRVLGQDDLDVTLETAVRFHDLGKLTEAWQERLGHGLRLPAHATLGASHLWRVMPEPYRGPMSFAVAIHHSDRGLLGDNIEKPDVRAILDGIIAHNTGLIRWDERARTLPDALFPKEASHMTLGDLHGFARGLRTWARGGSFMEQHTRRIRAMLVHHVLKLCDIAAASERRDWEGEKSELDESNLYGGWLMVRQLTDYVASLGTEADA